MPASPSDESSADVLAAARAHAAPGQVVHPGTRIDALEHLSAPGAWLGLFIWAGLPDIVDGPQPPSFEPPETLADAARILDALRAFHAANRPSPIEAPPQPAPVPLAELHALERTREDASAHPHFAGAASAKEKAGALWWHDDRSVCVLEAGGGAHSGAELARFVARALESSPAGDMPVAAHARYAIDTARKLAKELWPNLAATTIMAGLAKHGRRIAVAHVGDARVVRVRGAEVETLTRDHAVETGSPGSHILWQTICGNHESTPDVSELDGEPGDVLALCTSEVWRAFPPSELAAAVARHGREAARVMVAHARARERSYRAAVALVFVD